MNSDRLFRSESKDSGLVIVFPSGVKGLFSPHVHRVVREVEDRLEGVFVTYALSGGDSPDLDAAVNAARFAGCSSAIIIRADDGFGGDDWIDATSDTLWQQHHDSVELSETARHLVETYKYAASQSGVAA